MTYDPKHRSGQKVGALGMSNLYLIHSLKCERGGLPKLVRQNAFQIAIVNNTANKKELQSLCEACSGRVDEDVFYDLYKRSQQKDHDTFLIDFLYRKDDHPSMFRRNLDEFLIPDKSDTYESSVPEKKKKKRRAKDKLSKAEQRRLAEAEQPSPNDLAVDNVNTENKIC